ncbi:hypothetical protein [Pseudoclavibacter helvolus]|uniref:Uncharacterized protein n=1 Tax=Pseudoclavibacter helvolus TaxID=255205 RepID=A0A7W4ULY5_9MICO|nr:hypothetical protein [Pseudoclavibacter helvolus]MBB2956813.1 hypothetical protein [Pseudoclavibacter helvolus]
MTSPTHLQLVQAASNVVTATHPINPVLKAARDFTLAELRQGEHELTNGRAPKPRLMHLAKTITRGEIDD